MPSSMTFQFLDVGMGDGTLVQIRPEGQAYDTLVLVDFGEDKTQFDVAMMDALTYLITTIDANSVARGSPAPWIDYLFITHSDRDHHNRLKILYESVFPHYGQTQQLRFGEVYYGGWETEYKSGIIQELAKRSNRVSDMQECYRAKISGGVVTPDFTFGPGINIYVLSVNYPTKKSKPNPKSIVLMFEFGQYKTIMQGDAEGLTEDGILEYFGEVPGFLKSTALKLGHHGGSKATSKEWVSAVQPKAIFASGDFVWTHPYCDAICRVVNGGSLESIPSLDVWYCCGFKSNYYNNHHHLAICMNLWYFVKSVPGEWLTFVDADKVKWVPTRVTYGVQWALSYSTDRPTMIERTRAVIPYDVLAIPKGWDCTTGRPEFLQIGPGPDVKAPPSPDDGALLAHLS